MENANIFLESGPETSKRLVHASRMSAAAVGELSVPAQPNRWAPARGGLVAWSGRTQSVRGVGWLARGLPHRDTRTMMTQKMNKMKKVLTRSTACTAPSSRWPSQR